MLDKLSGQWAPKPSAGPHKSRECLPLMIFLRNRLKYALTRREVQHILMQRLVKVDGKVRTDVCYPAGLMDVITIEKTDEHFRLIYDVRGKFSVHAIPDSEAKFKLCKVKKQAVGPRGIPYVVTHDGRTINYPEPDVKVADTVKVNIETGKIEDFAKFDNGNACIVTGGHNIGRVGVIVSRERHPGSFEVIHLKDAAGHSFNTRAGNVFVIGKGKKSMISLPRGKGIKLTVLEEFQKKQQ